MKQPIDRDNAAIIAAIIGGLVNLFVASFNGAWLNWTAAGICAVIATIVYIRKP